MMHSKPTQLLCRHLINYCADTRGVTGGVKCPVWIVGWRRLSGFAVRGLKSDECDSWRLKYGLIPKFYRAVVASLPGFSAVRIHPLPLSPPLALARRILLPKPSASRRRSLLHSPKLGASSSPSLARAPAPRGQPHPPAHLLRDGSCSNFISSSSATVPASFLILHVSKLLLFFSLPLMVARLKLKGIDGRAPPGVEPAA